MQMIVFFFSFLSIFNSQKTETGNRPNIIFIITDDHKADALSYLGHKYVKTPHMDQLAKKGIFFKNAFATTPICAASRASILTGIYERTHRYTFQSGSLDRSLLLNAYPKLLKEAGYTTAMFGKLGVNIDDKKSLYDQIEDYDRNNSFKDKRGYFYKTIGKDTVHLSAYTGHKGIDFINNVDKKKPFMLNLCFSAPHAHDGAEDQFFTSKAFDNLLDGVTIPKPILSDDQYFLAQPEGVRNGFSRLRWTWRFDNPEKYQKMMKGYYNMISEIDAEVGKIIVSLKKNGLDKNTIIIVMGDNGYLLGERQLADKWLMYDASVKVPLIIYDPRSKINKEVDEMVLNIDVSSSILAYAGIKLPSQYQGLSLVALNTTQKSQSVLKRDTILLEHLWEFDEIPPSEGIRTKKWKYLRYINDKNWEELYDLENDPIEAVNLAKNSKHVETLIKLRSACDRQIAQKIGAIGQAPFGLTTENIRKPEHTVIYDLNPEFGWKIPAESKYQSAYQILLSSNEKELHSNQGNLWDSKYVKSQKSQDISYRGTPLEVGKTYFWKVRIWDESNRLSDYSEIQKFKTDTNSVYSSSPNFFQVEYITPTSSWKNKDNSVTLDFGKHAFGTLHFVYDAPKDDTLIIALAEKINDDGTVDSEPGGTIRYQKCKSFVKKGRHAYILKLTPDIRNTLPIAAPMPDTFPVVIPFRYAQLFDQTSVKSADFKQSRFNVYWEDENSYFTSNDTILNQVFDMCKYTIKATSFTGLYVDGDRERIPYEADAYLNQLSHYTTDPEIAIGRQTIEWFMRKPTWPTEWQQHVALMMHADYMYTGNTELIKKYYEAIKYKTLIDLVGDHGLVTSTKANKDFMKKLGFDDPNIVLKDITDWPPAQKDTGWKLATAEGERDGFVFKPYNTLINALYYANLKIMAEFAEVVGKTDEKLRFEEAAGIAKKSINEQMFDKKRGVYVDGIGTDHASLHSNMFALAFDIVPPDRVASVVAFIKTRGMACSVYGAQYLLEGLYKAGESQYALELMNATHDRSWYNMIKVGSTVALEAWDIKYKPNLDWNHAWGAVPANIIPRGLWGIIPETPGCQIMTMKPQMASLEHSKIMTPTLLGNISAEYKKANPRKSMYMVEVPANMNIKFYPAKSEEFVLTHNGSKVSPIAKYLILEPGKHIIECNLNSF